MLLCLGEPGERDVRSPGSGFLNTAKAQNGPKMSAGARLCDSRHCAPHRYVHAKNVGQLSAALNQLRRTLTILPD